MIELLAGVGVAALIIWIVWTRRQRRAHRDRHSTRS